MNEPNRTVVVGAGASGLAAARLLARHGVDVTVIEAASTPGGTWNAFEADGGLRFDRGIRLAMATGDRRLDHAIYGSLDLEWHRIAGFPREGHVVRGRLSTENQCPDARHLGVGAARRALIEIHRGSEVRDAPELAAALSARFGPTLTEHLYRPFLRKVFGAELEALDAGAARFFVPSRVTLTDRGQTERHMRESSQFRRRLAHPSSRGLRAPGRAFYYPAFGAMGGWIKAAHADLERQAHVTLRFGARVESVVRDGDRVRAVELASGERVACDALVWARPPAMLARAAQMPTPAARPRFRDLAVVHLVADAEPSTDVLYAPFFDEDHAIHRAFFYREVRPRASALERRAVSCEVILGPDDELDERALAKRALRELREVGLMPRDAWLERAWVERFSRVFPVPTPELAEADRACRAAVGGLENVAVVGRSAEAPFLDSILRSCDREVSRLLGCAPVARAA